LAGSSEQSHPHRETEAGKAGALQVFLLKASTADTKSEICREVWCPNIAVMFVVFSVPFLGCKDRQTVLDREEIKHPTNSKHNKHAALALYGLATKRAYKG